VRPHGESEDISRRWPDDTAEANRLSSLASRMKVRSGAASTRPSDAGRIPPLTQSCTGMAPHPPDEGARIGGSILGRRAHVPPGPLDRSSVRGFCGVSEYRQVMEGDSGES